MAYIKGFRHVPSEVFSWFVAQFADITPQQGPDYFYDRVTAPSEYMSRTNWCQSGFTEPMAIALHTDRRYDENCELQPVPEAEKNHVYLLSQFWYDTIPADKFLELAGSS